MKIPGWLKPLWKRLKPDIRVWLGGRALVLPMARKQALSRQYGVSEDIITAINDTAVAYALEEFDKL